VIYAYCVRCAADPEPPSTLRGVDGADVRSWEHGGIGLWLSELDARPASTLERLREHDAVVRVALRRATPLPIRFGTLFADEAELRRSVEERTERYLEQLARVRGHVEMGVTLWWAGESAPEDHATASSAGAGASPSSGTEYLELRRREHRAQQERHDRAAALLEMVERSLPVPADRRCTMLPEPGAAARVAHLVHRSEVMQYRAQVKSLGPSFHGSTLVVTGPWAPYSFV
jgi:hypothetical protein